MSRFSRLLLATLMTVFLGAAMAQDGELTPTVEFTLAGGIGSQGFEWLGVGGDIDGVRNPDLNVNVGDVVKVTIISTDGMEHDFAIDDLEVLSEPVSGEGQEVSIVFEVTEAGSYIYYCTTPGHAMPEANFGMFGNFVVGE